MKHKVKKEKFLPVVQLTIKENEDNSKLSDVSVTMTITNTVFNSKTNTQTKVSKDGKVTLKFKKQKLDEVVLLHMDDMSHSFFTYDKTENVEVEGCRAFTDECPNMTTSL